MRTFTARLDHARNVGIQSRLKHEYKSPTYNSLDFTLLRGTFDVFLLGTSVFHVL